MRGAVRDHEAGEEDAHVDGEIDGRAVAPRRELMDAVKRGLGHFDDGPLAQLGDKGVERDALHVFDGCSCGEVLVDYNRGRSLREAAAPGVLELDGSRCLGHMCWPWFVVVVYIDNWTVEGHVISAL